jgi:hypothetical protein
MKKSQFHKIFAVLFCLLLLTSVFTKPSFAEADKLFFLSPTIGWYFPTNGKTKNAFGDSWTSWGIALNLEALGGGIADWEIAGLRLQPYFNYFHTEKGDNDAYVIPVGLDARWDLGKWGVVSPYVGLGVAGYGIRFEDRGAGVDTGWRGAFGGRLMFGADITRWFNIQAAYNMISDVEGYDLSGFSVQGKLKIYF